MHSHWVGQQPAVQLLCSFMCTQRNITIMPQLEQFPLFKNEAVWSFQHSQSLPYPLFSMLPLVLEPHSELSSNALGEFKAIVQPKLKYTCNSKWWIVSIVQVNYFYYCCAPVQPLGQSPTQKRSNLRGQPGKISIILTYRFRTFTVK